MSFLFADSFDVYGSIGDLTTRYSATNFNLSYTALGSAATTAFGAGQSLQFNSTVSGTASSATFNWGSNEPSVFASLRLKWNSVNFGSSSAYFYLSLQDGTNSQCTIRWNGDGSIGFYSGGPTGTLLQTFTGQFFPSMWDSWQIKAVIDNAAGSIELRKNGAPAATISVSTVNTRAGSTNAYANAFTYGTPTLTYFQLDDFFLCSASGAAPNSWTGDIRSVQQTPIAQTQAQFTATSASNVPVDASGGVNQSAVAANTAVFVAFTAGWSFSISAVQLSLSAAITGHMQAAIYDATGLGGTPGNLLASSVALTNPTGSANFTFSAPLALAAGTPAFLAFLSDVSWTPNGTTSISNYVANNWSVGATYSVGFPAIAGAVGARGSHTNCSLTIATGSNAGAVASDTEDGDASYVSSSTVGQEDIYTLSPIPTTFALTGVNYYAMWKKTDAGARTAALSLAANGSGDTIILTNSSLANSYVYSQTLLTLDPTGAAWTPTSVNAAQLGIKITA